jgi:hypothetical protein
MKVFGRLALTVLASAAFLHSTPCRAASVSISQSKVQQCGFLFVFCNNQQAYSLSELESGAVQIPIFPILPSEVVIVNDTGRTVNSLELTLNTIQIFSFNAQCRIAPSARSLFNECNVASGPDGPWFDPFSPVTANFTFLANGDEGIPDGAYFDVTTAGFLCGGFITGGGTTTGPTGPPEA